jgi:hypothetical protein
MEFKRENCNERWAVYFEERNNKFNNISQKEYDNSGNPIIEYTKINPTKYRVRVHSAEGVFPMVFSESFHEGWRAYVTQVESSKSKVQSNLEKYKILDGNEDDPKVINDGASPKVANGDGASQASVLDNYKILDGNEEDQASKSELEYFIKKGWVTSLGNLKERIIEHNKWEDNKEKLDYEEKYSIDFISKNFQDTIQNDNLPTGKFYETWLKKPLNADNHLMINGYANSWMIDVNEVCEKENVCVKNSDGSYDFEMVIEFWPQRLFYIGLGISGMTLFSCLVYLVYDWRKKRKLRANELK